MKSKAPDAVWLTVRNVGVADGQAVVGSQRRLDEAFAVTGDQRIERLRDLVNESARFNIGRAFRNFNYPTQVLSYLDPALQPRFDFTVSGRERSSGETIGTVSVDVRYQRHSALAMWVPSRMVETYVDMQGATVTERISGEATYTNVRRFETSGRLVPPP